MILAADHDQMLVLWRPRVCKLEHVFRGDLSRIRINANAAIKNQNSLRRSIVTV
jgi:hypothetical protein